MPYDLVRSLASQYVVRSRKNDEATRKTLTSDLTYYEWYDVVGTPNGLVSCQSKTRTEPPMEQDCDDFLAKWKPFECAHIKQEVAKLFNDEWVAELVEVTAKNFLSYAVKLSPHPLLGLTNLEDLFYDWNRRPVHGRYQPPPPPPRAQRAESKPREPLIVLSTEDDILRRWPNPIGANLSDGTVAAEKVDIRQERGTEDGQTTATEIVVKCEALHVGDVEDVKEEEWNSVDVALEN